MKALEWNPSFGPVITAMIVLGVGLFFFLLFPRLLKRHERTNAWALSLPKIIVAALMVIALLDPDFKFTGSNSQPTKVLIFEDISSSMDLRDDGASTRADRAAQIVRRLESGAPSSMHFEVLPFDTSVHPAGYAPKDATVERGTDITAPFLALGNQANLADAGGAVVITDGGDETVELANLPSLPLAIIGVGASPENWNDIGIGNVTAPATAEDKTQFDLEADLYARPGTHTDLKAIKVTLEEAHDKSWTTLQTEAVDLSSMHAAAAFRVLVNGAGTERYRVSLPHLPGELTYANNSRTVDVQVQQRAIHVLYFTQELGVDYKYLRAELATDPGVAFTAMYRVLEDQFTVQGDRTGFADLAKGFPSKDDVLKRYDCVILGSTPAGQFTDDQQEALVRFVQNGGALILLGGESSFGRGGYAESKLAPLMPWAIQDNEAGLETGRFPVTVAASGLAVDFTSGLRESLAAAGGVTLDSINQPGGLRPGAISLLDVAEPGGTQPVVAWQRYGSGQVLGIATNTLWKWAATGGETKSLFGRFWRQAVRGVTKKLEGGSLLGIHWNQDRYRPGEQAVIEVRVRSGAEAGAIRLVGSVSGPGGDHDIDLSPVVGQADLYTAKVELPQRGDYTFRLSAYSGANLAESYERALTVEPMLEEGASPELKEAYLKNIASRASGIYAYEKDTTSVATFLRQQVISQQGTRTVPLVNVWDVFACAIILLLVSEWILRRRLNLV